MSSPSIDPVDVQRMMSTAFPKLLVADYEAFSGGLINTNLKVHFESDHDPVVLRIYRDGANICRKEAALYRLVQGDVPLPRVLHAEPNGLDGSRAFAILEYVHGITFQQLKKTRNLKAIQQAAYSVGQTLAAIGHYQFPKPGRLVVEEPSDRLAVGKPYIEGPEPIPRMLDTFLASPKCRQRLDAPTIHRLHDLVWTTRLPELEDECSLVHSDFGSKNVLLNEENGEWVVAAVIDWEFAFSGSPLLDVGHFLRYERSARPLREPFFSRAFTEHGGDLPEDWRNIVRVIDLTGSVEYLTREVLPADVEAEIIELIQATLDELAPS
jgi:aminoglycoside phosphotransferase (APT) family kinase protein